MIWIGWISLAICIFGAVSCLALLTVDFGKCWDQAESIKSKRKKIAKGDKNV